MSNDTKVRDETIDGKTFAIYVDQDGEFCAQDMPNERPVTSDTIKGLIDKLRKRRRTAKVRVSLPATIIAEHGGWLRGNKDPIAEPVLVTGIHATRHKPLITHANGDKEAFDANSEWLTRRLTDDEAAQWLALCEAKRAADMAVEAFKDQMKIPNVKQWIADALVAAGTAPADASEALADVDDSDQD